MTLTDDSHDFTPPTAYADEGPSALEQALRHGLKRDATWLDPRTVVGHSRALTVLLLRRRVERGRCPSAALSVRFERELAMD